MAPMILHQIHQTVLVIKQLEEQCALGQKEPASIFFGAEGSSRLADLTHAYSCCVCFDDFLLRAMARALGDASLFPRFQALVALRELPAQPHLVCVGEARLACSWNGAAPAWVYVPADVCARSGLREPPRSPSDLCQTSIFLDSHWLFNDL